MRLFDRNSGTAELRQAFRAMISEVDRLDEEQERLKEAVQGTGLAALRAEDKGWRLISGGMYDRDEIDLDVLLEHAADARALRAMNPLVKRGVVVRNAYIWKDEITYPDSANSLINNPINQREFFSQEAREELEAAYCTDGQYFLLLDRGKREIRRIPLREITGVIVNPDHDDEIWYYRRTYTRTRTATDGTGVTEKETVETYYPSIHLGDRRPLKVEKIGDVPIDHSKVIEHSKVNSATGWRYGVPDLLGAVYWARAYKEALEADYTLKKALARFAFKISNQSSRGGRAVAAKLAQPAPRSEAGSTVTLGAGQDLQAINKSGSSVDFSGSSPLAGMVAAALDVPLSVILTDGSAGGRQGAEAALEDPTIKTMNRRRRTHLDSRRRVLKYFGIRGEITWHDLDGDLVHRRLQSIQLADSMGVLHPEETRAEALNALSVVTDKAVGDIPEKYTKKEEKPEFGDGPGPLSDGTNDSRDTPGGATNA